jgi:hypothetical protein
MRLIVARARSVVATCAAALLVSCGSGEQAPAADRPPVDGVPKASESRSPSTGVIINEREVSEQQLNLLRQKYGMAPPPGSYWYDSKSGLYGYWGREAAGYIRTGHDFGPLSERASSGNTGVFINNREINLAEAFFVQRMFGVVYLGHFWLDGNTGYLGLDGDPRPRANLAAAMRMAQQRQGSGEYHWRDGSGGVVSSQGNCTFAAIPGAPVYSTPGCG